MRYPTILLALFCAACGSYSANVPSIKPYKMEIQQGNIVTSKMMMQLRPGMTKSQVRFIMGTPLLVDSFHADRWDYFYQMRKDGKIIEQRRVTLEFDADTLARVRGDVIPASSDSAGAAAAPGKMDPKSLGKTPAKQEKGWLDKLKFWGDDKAEAQPQQAQPESKPAEAKPAEAQPEQKAAPKAADPARPAPKAEPAQPAPAPESAQSEQPQEKLPPLMDPAMQPKPDAAEAAPQQTAPKKLAPVPAEQPVSAAPAAAEQPAPAPAQEADKPARAETKSKSRKAKATSGKPAPEPKAMTAPQPPTDKDLPPEDAPDFFEKMLEKIGF